QALVGDDLHVAGAVGADGREGAVGDVIVGDDDVAGAEDVDAVAVLAGAAAARRDALDAVAGDDGAVAAGLPATDQDAAVGSVATAVPPLPTISQRSIMKLATRRISTSACASAPSPRLAPSIDNPSSTIAPASSAASR